jgi:hypothetical protein
MLRYCLGLGTFSANKPFGYAFLVIILHVIISYTCWVLYVLTLALFPAYSCDAVPLRR